MTDVEEPTTTTQKFELLLKDFSAHLDTGKALSARMKTLQKEVAKVTKPGKRRATKSISDDSDSDAPKRPSALQKPVKISDELCTFLGFDVGTEHSRQEVTKTVNSYIKDNDLQDPANRRFIKLEDTEAGKKLKVLLRDPDQPVTFFNIQRYLKPHYPPSKESLSASKIEPPEIARQEPIKTEVVKDAEVVEEAPKEKAPAKRRVVRRTTN